MKTQKHINTLKRGEIIEALQLTKLGSLIKPLRYQLELKNMTDSNGVS